MGDSDLIIGQAQGKWETRDVKLIPYKQHMEDLSKWFKSVEFRQWHEKFSFALLRYRTIVRTSAGATPYLLVYGTEVVIPVEVEIPSLRIIVETEIEDNEWVKTRLE
nr:PREDICTED: uncharacterized protein LOC104233794 [Nicotiana sylvestris]